MIKLEFEGADGAGKTSGLKYFIEQARKRGYSVVETREVGNPHIPSCVKLREFVLDPASNLSGEAMELIFSAMRIESDIWLKNIAKSENPPDFVVSDRGYFSHLAYGLHNTSESFVNGLFVNLMAKQTALPDVVIYFSVDTEVALQRRVKRASGMDVIELKGVEYQERVKRSFEEYLAFAERDGKTTTFVVDANQSLEGVQKQLDEILADLKFGIGGLI